MAHVPVKKFYVKVKNLVTFYSWTSNVSDSKDKHTASEENSQQVFYINICLYSASGNPASLNSAVMWRESSLFLQNITLLLK